MKRPSFIEGPTVILADGRRFPADQLPYVFNRHLEPVRESAVFKSMRNLTGKQWCSTTGGYVAFESIAERDVVLVADFDPTVTWIVPQPFTLWYEDETGLHGHTPDFALMCSDGDCVVDVRPHARVNADFERDAEATAALIEPGGIRFKHVGGVAKIFLANVAALNHEKRIPAPTAAAWVQPVLDRCVAPVTIGDAVSSFENTGAARTVLNHLLWHKRIEADLTVPLQDTSIVWTSDVPLAVDW